MAINLELNYIDEYKENEVTTKTVLTLRGKKMLRKIKITCLSSHL